MTGFTFSWQLAKARDWTRLNEQLTHFRFVNDLFALSKPDLQE
jgi:hypothetical protein